MSVASRNPFALLDDDAGAQDTPQPAPAVVETPAPAASATRGNQRARGSGGPASRGGRYYARGGANKGPSKDQEGAADGDAEPKKFDGDRRGRGAARGGRGEGRGRGDRGERRGGGGGGASGRGRVYDKHSATGLTDSDKKVHQSWGGDDGPTELAVETQAANDAAAAADAGDWAGTAAAGDDAWAADTSAPPAQDGAPLPAEANGDAGEAKKSFRERERDEDEDLLTLEEYQAQQKAKLPEGVIPKLEARKANDGTDDTALFKGAVKLNKDEEEDAYFAGKAKAAPKARTKKEEKVVIEIDARFERPRTERGGFRGGRGGDRGGRGRGGDRPERGSDRPRGRGRGRGDAPPQASRPYAGGGGGGNVDVNDTSAFPSLG